MTNEQYEALQKYEDKFRWAIRQNFLSMAQGEFLELMKIYNEFFTPLSNSQTRCGTCRLRAMKTLGELYFKEQQERAEKAKEQRMESTTQEEPKQQPKKRGRKKAIDKIEEENNKDNK